MSKSNVASGNNRPARWTWIELTGLALAVLLIVGPAVNLLMTTLFPAKVEGAGPPISASITVSPATVGPGDTFTYIVKATANTQINLGSISISPLSGTGTASLSASGCIGGQIFISNCGSTMVTTYNGSPSNQMSAGNVATVSFTFVNNSAATPNLTFNASATVCDENNACSSATAQQVLTTTGPNGNPTPTPAPTPTPVPPTPTPTNTPVPGSTPTPTPTPTNTPVPGSTPTPTPTPTNTPVPGSTPTPTPTPTNTPVPGSTPTPTQTPTNTPVPGSTPIPTPTPTFSPVSPIAGVTPNTPVGPPATFVPFPTSGGVVTSVTPGTPFVLPTNTPGGPTVVQAPNPAQGITPVALPTRSGPGTPNGSPTSSGGGTSGTPANPQSNVVTGVIAGSFSGSGLNGNRVDLILRSGGTDKVVTTALIDGSGQYTFLSARVTAVGETYYVRYSSPNGGGSLRIWTSTSFAFPGGRLDVSAADLTDVVLGNPGNTDTTFQLPLTLNWTSRGPNDRYSITVYRSDGSGLALTSGDLGNGTAFTIAANALIPGDYFAQVNVSNASGSGISQRQFRFRISAGSSVLIPGSGTAVPLPTSTTSAQIPTVSGGGTPGNGNGGGGTATPLGSPLPTSTTSPIKLITPGVTSGIGLNGAATATPISAGNQSGTPGSSASNTGNGNPDSGNLPPGTTSLPQSGGELPLAGLLLAAITLGIRRFRLTVQTRRG